MTSLKTKSFWALSKKVRRLRIRKKNLNVNKSVGKPTYEKATYVKNFRKNYILKQTAMIMTLDRTLEFPFYVSNLFNPWHFFWITLKNMHANDTYAIRPFNTGFFVSFAVFYFLSFCVVISISSKLTPKVIYFTEQWLRSRTKEIQERFLKIVLKQEVLRNEHTSSAIVANFQGDSEFLILLSCKQLI